MSRVAEEARAGEEAANSGGDKAEEDELIALEAEVRILGHTPRGEQPTTNSWVATSVPDGTSRVDTTQEEEPHNPKRGRSAGAVLAKRGSGGGRRAKLSARREPRRGGR